MSTGELTVEYTELHNGDHMSQAEFHRIYSRMPEDFRAELIGGVVYVASPLKRAHGTPHVYLGTLLGTYALRTLGTEPGDNTTLILGADSEPQPELHLRVLPEYGGRSSTDEDDYVLGSPEFVLEVANTSHTIDLHAKLEDYTRYGVVEYLVLSVRDRSVHWFDLGTNEELELDDGVARIRTFPGLWIDGPAVLERDARMLDVLDEGLATPEHAAFVERLSKQRTTDH